MPNPAGGDAGREFIEIYNPTDIAVPLEGCELRLGEAGKKFSLPSLSLPARGFHVFYDAETKIVLPNAVGQTVWLISADDEQGVRYGDGLLDDQSWSYIGGVWKTTLLATPGSANILRDPIGAEKDAEDEEPLSSSSGKVPEGCSPGKERNPLTNRCRIIATHSPQLEPCKEGYERNPETGRCRKVIPTTPKIPCKAGQERGPETGRCRSVLGAAMQPKACPEGQERNSETNRCRKTTGGTGESLATVQDVRSASSATDTRWWIAGVLAMAAVGYAIYEWRQDIWQAAAKVKGKVRGKPG